MPLSGIDWKLNGKTLLLAVKSSCRFCTESGPFYERLGREAGRRGIKIIAVAAEPEADARDYLHGLSVKVADVRQAQLSKLGIVATPTVVLVDSEGRVTRLWRGKLRSDVETELLNSLEVSALQSTRKQGS